MSECNNHKYSKPRSSIRSNDVLYAQEQNNVKTSHNHTTTICCYNTENSEHKRHNKLCCWSNKQFRCNMLSVSHRDFGAWYQISESYSVWILGTIYSCEFLFNC